MLPPEEFFFGALGGEHPWSWVINCVYMQSVLCVEPACGRGCHSLTFWLLSTGQFMGWIEEASHVLCLRGIFHCLGSTGFRLGAKTRKWV